MSDSPAIQCHRCGKEARVGRTHVLCENLDCGTVTTPESLITHHTRYREELAEWAKKISPVPYTIHKEIVALYEKEYTRIDREIAILKETPTK